MQPIEERIALPAGEVHLWLSFHGEQGDAEANQRHARLLSSAERDKQSAFHFLRDRYQYLLTRAMVRTVLSRYVPVSPAEWRFAANAFGRPHIVDPGLAQTRALRFNVSHTQGLIAVAVARGAEIGVDVENALRPAMLYLAERVFSPAEARALHALSPLLQQQRFFELWTLKESYIKARGMGLQLALDKLSFSLEAESGIGFAIDASLEDVPQRWAFWQARVGGQHLVAVCAEKSDAAVSRLVCRELSPSTFEVTSVALEVRRSGG